MLAAGILRETVTIEKPKPTATADAHGHVDGTSDANWVEHCCHRAEVIGTGARETVSGDKVITLNSYRLRMRHDGLTREITTRMRVRWCDRTLHIDASFDPDGMRREWRLDCTEAA